MKKLKLFSLALMALFSTGVWAADITVTPTLGTNAMTLPSGLFTISHSSTKGDSKISSGAIAANSKDDIITINFKTSKSDMYIKSVTFNSLSNGTLSTSDGTISSNTFTVSGNKSDVNVVLTSNSNAKGTVKITNVIVNTGENEVETITFDSFDGTAKTFGFTSSAGASSSLTSISSNNSNSVSDHILSWSNSRTLVFEALGKIKYAAFVLNDGKVATGFTTDAGTYVDDYSWTGDVETLTFTNGTGGGKYIRNFYLIIEPAAKHSVTYDLNGGTGTTPTQEDVAESVKFTLHDGTTGITPPAANKVFVGWSDGTTNYAGGAQYTMGTSDVNLTAQWATSYDVKFFQGYGEPDVQIGETQSIGEGAFAIAPADPERDGYAFMGWSFDATIANVVNVAEYPITAETNFTAIWLHHYAVTYNKGAYGSGTIEAGEKIEGIAFTLSSERFTRENYVQVGWATTDGGAQAYSLGGSYTANADIELFPVWMEAESYTFTYSGSKTISQLESEGWEFNSASATPTADGGEFVNLVETFIANGTGTTALKNNNVQDMDDKAIAFAKNAGAYAIFDLGEEVKIVNFSATLYGGSGKGFDQVIQYIGADGSTIKKEYTNNLDAGNWQANNINKNDVVEDVHYIKIYGASKWVVMSELNIAYVSKRTITFAAGEGEGNMDDIQYYSGDEVTLPDCEFTAPENKVFAAWTSENVTIKDGKFTMPANDVTITATYVQTYAVNIAEGIENGNVSADKNRAAAGETVTLTIAPVTGYKLATLKVLKASDDSDVTDDVLEGNVLTMPAYAVKVVATFDEDSATAISNTEVEVKAVKRIENGMLVIEKDGKTYNVMGVRIR